MTKFEISVSPLKLQPTGRTTWGRPIRRLVQPMYVYIVHDGGMQRLCVPAGFETDLASWPKIVARLLDHPSVAPAAVAHDYACVIGLPSFYAHALMRTILLALGAPKSTQRLMFWAVMVMGPGGPAQWLTRKLGIGMSSKRKGN